MFEAWEVAKEEMAKAGVLIDCAPLQPPSAATTVQVRDGQTLLTDGPAAEIKEQFGGYPLIECTDLDEALKWAATIPTASDGSVEVRPVIEVVAPPSVPSSPAACGSYEAMTAAQGRAERRNGAAPSRRPGPAFAPCGVAHLRY
jgi:hypothetical protein